MCQDPTGIHLSMELWNQTYNLCFAIVAYSDHSFFPVCGSFHFQSSFHLHAQWKCRRKLAWNERNQIHGRKNDLNMLLLRSTHSMSVWNSAPRFRTLLSSTFLSRASPLWASYNSPPKHVACTLHPAGKEDLWAVGGTGNWQQLSLGVGQIVTFSWNRVLNALKIRMKSDFQV